MLSLNTNNNGSHNRVIKKSIQLNQPPPLMHVEQDVNNTESFKDSHLGSQRVSTEPQKPEEKVIVDYMNEDFIMNDLSKQTKPADDAGFIKSKFGDKNVDEIRDEIKRQEQQQSSKMTASDMENVAKFLINIIDTGATMAFRFWAKDTTNAGYGMTAGNKSMLTEQLTMILVKYQAKFSLEFMFLMALVLSLATPFMKARERKKEIQQEKREHEEKMRQKQNRPWARQPQQKQEQQKQSIPVKKVQRPVGRPPIQKPIESVPIHNEPVKQNVDQINESDEMPNKNDLFDDDNSMYPSVETNDEETIPTYRKKYKYVPRRRKGGQNK